MGISIDLQNSYLNPPILENKILSSKSSPTHLQAEQESRRFYSNWVSVLKVVTRGMGFGVYYNPLNLGTCWSWCFGNPRSSIHSQKPKSIKIESWGNCRWGETLGVYCVFRCFIVGVTSHYMLLMGLWGVFGGSWRLIKWYGRKRGFLVRMKSESIGQKFGNNCDGDAVMGVVRTCDHYDAPKHKISFDTSQKIMF